MLDCIVRNHKKEVIRTTDYRVKRHCNKCGRWVWRREFIDRFMKQRDYDLSPIECNKCRETIIIKREGHII